MKAALLCRLHYSSFKYRLLFVDSIAEYSVYYDELVTLLGELQTLIPEAQAETAALVAPVRCQQRGSNTRDVQLALKCLDFLAPRASAGIDNKKLLSQISYLLCNHLRTPKTLIPFCVFLYYSRSKVFSISETPASSYFGWSHACKK